MKEIKENDPRVTGVGRVLRLTSLEELPQLWQVVKGDWSMVGPRWFGESDKMYLDSLSTETVKAYYKMLGSGIKPGITGFYGIFGRIELPWKLKMELEIMYAERASLIADLRIIGLTIPAVLKRRGAF